MGWKCWSGIQQASHTGVILHSFVISPTAFNLCLGPQLLLLISPLEHLGNPVLWAWALPSLMHRAPAWGSQHAGVCSLARCPRWEAKKMPSSLTPCCVLHLGGPSCMGKVLIGERECKFIRYVLRLPFTLEISCPAAAGSSPGLLHFLELLNGRQLPRAQSRAQVNHVCHQA